MALDDFFSKFAPVDTPNRTALAPSQQPAPDSFDDLLDSRKEPALESLEADREELSNFIEDANSENDLSSVIPSEPNEQNLFGRPDDLNDQLGERLKRVMQNRSKKLLRFVWGLAVPALFILSLSIITLWMWSSGRMDVYVFRVANSIQSSSSILGLTIDDVSVNGRGYTSLDDVIEAISARNGDAILGLNPAAVKRRLETLPWVETASVERILPDKLQINLVERVPVAIWQNNGMHRLIDENGIEILGAPVEPFADQLPIVTGLNAPKHSHTLFNMLKGEPELLEQTLAATRVGDRRWDIMLIGEVIVKLPDNDVQKAWSLLAETQRRSRLLDRNIKTVDLRLPDRIIVTSAHDLMPNPVNFTIDTPVDSDENVTAPNNKLTDI